LLLVMLALAFTAVALARLLEIDGNRYVVAAVALTPHVTAAGLVLGPLALLLHRWAVGTVVTVLAVVLVAAVAPRAFPDSRPVGVGAPIRVMSANLYAGKADAGTVVAAVRDRRVDVLSLQELTPEAVTALDRAGLAGELPYRLFQAEPGASGSGIASRHPLQERTLSPPAGFRQPAAFVDLPGRQGIEVQVVHAHAPVVPEGPERWQRELAGLPERELDRPLRVLAGDFNGTLDHAAVRRLLVSGYADAAASVGAGLKPTWPSGTLWPPPVTIDHLLVDRRCPLDSYEVIDIPGSDHRAVLAQFVVPEQPY
jgi:endonuclease/exonuclease/phosphatase (EEP) superfamily protein YafD